MGYHEVSTGQHADIRSAAIRPRGDIAVQASNPAESQSTVVLCWSPFGQAGARPLPGAWPNSTPSGYVRPWAHNIRHGVVTGGAATTDLPGPSALVWAAPGYAATPLDHGADARDINASGLIAGAEIEPNVPEGPAAVWRGTTFLTELPLLDGAKKASARFIDDGAIAGWSSAGSVGDGGRPVVWRLVSTA